MASIITPARSTRLDHGAASHKAGGKSGFNALYAGFREPEDNTFRRTGKQTGFWTSIAADEL